MIKNYFKIAWRNLIKNKFFSLINIGGLAVGMVITIIISLWVYDELSFNKYHENYERISRVTKRGFREGKLVANGIVPLPLANELRSNYSQYFDHVLLASGTQESILTIGETKLSGKGIFIEPGAPQMLSLKMLKGSRTGLNDQQSVLLSAAVAKAIFGKEDPMNRIIKINANMDAKVTGVYEDLPRNTEFYETGFFAPFDLWTSTNAWIKTQGWNNHFLHVYAQIKPGLDAAQVSEWIKDAELNRIKDMPERKEEVARNMKIWLQPMSDWHLRADLSGNGPVQLVWMIGLIGVFVLLLACINFMNLSTARSEKRAKEVGIRKAIGSLRMQLIRQFFAESVLVVLLAFILALLIVVLSLPLFNEIAGKKMMLPLSNPFFWLFSVCFILVTGMIAGSYPALYLSSFHPVKILKGTFRAGRFASLPRKALVVVQFTISAVLITGTLIVFRQVQYAKDRPIGYNRKGLLLIEKKTSDFYGKFPLLEAELKRTGVVSFMAESRSSTTGITMWNGGFSHKGNKIDINGGSGTLPVTADYGKTVGWEFIAGRDFSSALASDSSGLVINESFARAIGLQHAEGEALRWDPGWREAKDFTILGVVKDMVALSPYEPAIPTAFFLSDKYHTWFNLRLNPGVSVAAALPKIEAVFKKVIPSAPFDYKFADDEYALKFIAEERIGKLASLFALFAIFISCLGLFGLASFIAEQRIKEIGIRKILGASVMNLWSLLSKEFVVLVTLAFIIAIPIAYYLMSQWLQKYVYHTHIGWQVFGMVGGGVLGITLITVSFQAIKAAITNPVKSLRTE